MQDSVFSFKAPERVYKIPRIYKIFFQKGKETSCPGKHLAYQSLKIENVDLDFTLCVNKFNLSQQLNKGHP